MQTRLADFINHTPEGEEAERILRRCVHCGFCNATCPTYQLLGDELDGPRGRIYLIKQMLEGQPVGAATQTHLDRCLTCRACETTCPSGVEYGRLVEIGRAHLAKTQPLSRSTPSRAMRWVLRETLPRRGLFSAALMLGRLARPMLPRALKNKIPVAHRRGPWPAASHDKRMLVLGGCVQPSIAPGINAATARVLDRLGISLIEARRAGCCGAVRAHLDDLEAARDDARRNIDAWWPWIEEGVEAIVMTASGCGAQVRDYAHLLQHDPAYAERAQRVVALTRDVSEVVEAALEEAALSPGATPRRIAFHAPCTLQHGQKIRGVVERILQRAGFALTEVRDAHLCCGSAGTYSILQPALATTLRDNKLAALSEGAPEAIATANIGCLAHLQSGTSVPVRHWIELLDEALAAQS
ncbi:MAG: hypothetical protein RIR70_774 [Pseudomonadota bacterium]|jgi:glycolate oxidase iron-sulfur subunit